jgi:hypothetical protein
VSTLWPSIFPIILFLPTTLSTRMTGTCNGLWLHSYMAVFSKRTIGKFLYGSNSMPISDQRSLPAQFWHWWIEWSKVWVSTKPLITEEIWTGRGLNPGLPMTRRRSIHYSTCSREHLCIRFRSNCTPWKNNFSTSVGMSSCRGEAKESASRLPFSYSNIDIIYYSRLSRWSIY